MVLIDSLFVNNGGGLVLLNYLISQINNTAVRVHYLLDIRTANFHSDITNGTYEYLNPSIVKRYYYYKK